jgi:hypothetical protein
MQLGIAEIFMPASRYITHFYLDSTYRRELEGVTQIGFVDPDVIRRETANPAVTYTTSDARERFIRVANSLAGQLSATSPV